ncbi:hypothetical protein PDIG_13430 [Penicillium digitatum PHI26]|uniref:Uncharacterized protein n=2 Tax=Penicillium digitatum TaxID=36651 RepID=K9G9M1_PEND2|nr:hypothetical protein PDIP_40560 [Penicillium digitatum Pd1]EKV15396.1 hypothetical protein PDIP_40560 [Penicillium digitatum Pd1]EKV17767.1 hypothetical protein PDIG_13430 [Penicillium digitatum PHI26]
MSPLELSVLSSSSNVNHASLTALLPPPDRAPSFTSPSDESSHCRDTTHCRPQFLPWKLQRPMGPSRGHTDLQSTTEKKEREEINREKRKRIRENQKEENISGKRETLKTSTR